MTNPYPSDPNWPADFNGCTVTGKFIDINGNPCSGTITFTMAPDVVFDYNHSTVIVRADIVISLDSDGAFSQMIPASNDPDINPQGWTYHVAESWGDAREYDIVAPIGETIDITEASPVASFTGVPILRGPPGPQGPAGSGAPVAYTLTSVSSWSHVHSFTYLPEVRLIDISGASVGCTIEYPDSSHVSISFPTPFSGTVILS